MHIFTNKHWLINLLTLIDRFTKTSGLGTHARGE